MSKTIIIMDAPEQAHSIEQIGDENAYFLGAFGEVIGVLKQIFPGGDFTNPTEITAHTEKGNIKIEIAKHTPVQSFMLEVDNEETIELVQKLCQKTNWKALDTDSGLFIDSRTKSHGSGQSKHPKSWWRFWKKQ